MDQMDQPGGSYHGPSEDFEEEASKAIVVFPSAMAWHSVFKMPTRFANARLEEDYLAEKRAITKEMVLKLGCFLMCCCAFFLCMWLSVIFQLGAAWKPQKYDAFQVAVLCLAFLTGLCRRLIAQGGETSILCIAHILILGSLMTSRARQHCFQGVLSKGIGSRFSEQELQNAFPGALPGELGADTFSILLVCMIVSATFQLQLRVSRCVCLMFGVPGIYLACTLPMPDFFQPTLQHRITIAASLAGLTYMNFLGQVKMEISARKEFFRRRHLQQLVIEEKCLRAGAEFESERRARGSSKTSPQDEQSMISAPQLQSEFSSALFNNDLGDRDFQLSALKTVASMEAWLIRPDDLRCNFREVLGKGKFGHVFKGTLHASPVAIKVTSQEDGDKYLPTLLAELRILRHIRHAHVIAFYGACICTEAKEVLLVEELVSGRSLEEVVRQAQPNAVLADKARQIILGVCFGLRYLHTHQPAIVHCDLSAKNVMVEAPNYVSRLIDFGLSRFESPKTRGRTGTLRWQAPETLMAHQVLKMSDIFSVGRLAFFVVTGSKPYQDVPTQALWQYLEAAVMQGCVPPLSWPAAGDLNAECKALCSKCFVFEPLDRPDVQELIEDITTWPSPPSPICSEVELTEALSRARKRIGRRHDKNVLSL